MERKPIAYRFTYKPLPEHSLPVYGYVPDSAVDTICNDCLPEHLLGYSGDTFVAVYSPEGEGDGCSYCGKEF